MSTLPTEARATFYHFKIDAFNDNVDLKRKKRFGMYGNGYEDDDETSVQDNFALYATSGMPEILEGGNPNEGRTVDQVVKTLNPILVRPCFKKTTKKNEVNL
jgi:hypothetical protein